MTSTDRHACLTALLARIAKLGMYTFAAGFVVVLIAVFVPVDHHRTMGVIALTSVAAMLLGGFTFISAIVLRDAVAQRWRFSLGALSVATTLLALLFRVVAMVLRGS